MDWMHLLFLAAATGAGGLAYGYRGQRESEREQVAYLRKQISGAAEPPPAGARALTTLPGRSNG